MMNNHEFKDLLNKYLAGKASEAEWNELARLVNKGGADELIKAQIDEEWESDNMEKEIPFERYHEMINKIMSAEKHIDHVIPLRKSKRYLWLAAASILLLFFAGYYFLSRPVEKQQPVTADIINIEAKPVQLPDGSTVLLAENSRLQYNKDFNGTKREVELWGEGYFDIKDVPGKPFVVKTGRVKTLVLGTAFNIKAYPDQPHIIITVTRGKVKVDDYGILTDNQQLSINTTENIVTRANVNSAVATAWKDEYLVLDDISMEEAAVIIGDKYHVKILLANEGLKTCRIGGSFFHNQPLEKVLDIVCAVINASYTIYPNNQVVIKGDGCHN
jgi:transmembrane sensor